MLIVNKPHSKLNGNKSNINYTDVGAKKKAKSL